MRTHQLNLFIMNKHSQLRTKTKHAYHKNTTAASDADDWSQGQSIHAIPCSGRGNGPNIVVVIASDDAAAVCGSLMVFLL
jgi:hypothetical protein